MKKILWCITGAGAYLRSIVYAMLSIRENISCKITLCFSKWGFEVSRIYGVQSVLKRIASGGYYEEWFIDEPGFYYIGRVNMKKYDLVVVAPATSNTVAKIVNGIADTLPTLVFSQALKSNIPIIVFPSDLPDQSGVVCSETPCFIDRDLCRCIIEGRDCVLTKHCPVGAVVISDGVAHVDLGKCTGCGVCIDKCRYSALKCWSTICIKPSSIDMSNVTHLSEFKNVYVVNTTDKLLETILYLIGGRSG